MTSALDICPLGYASLTNDCPNAPCIDCMRRLGNHLIAELEVLHRQMQIAHSQADEPAVTNLSALMTSLKEVVVEKERISMAVRGHGGTHNA